MMKTLKQKGEELNKIKNLLLNSEIIEFFDISGISTNDLNECRKILRTQGFNACVCKSTLLYRAVSEIKYSYGKPSYAAFKCLMICSKNLKELPHIILSKHTTVGAKKLVMPLMVSIREKGENSIFNSKMEIERLFRIIRIPGLMAVSLLKSIIVKLMLVLKKIGKNKE